MHLKRLFAYFLILVGILVMIHQYVYFGKPWDWNDALHHEWIVGVTIAFALGILVGDNRHK